jgi:hypothetical protein
LFKRTNLTFANFNRSINLAQDLRDFTNKISFINLGNREIILPAKTTKGGIHLRKIIIDNGLLTKK